MDVEEQERLVDAASAIELAGEEGEAALGAEEEISDLEIKGSVLVVSYFRFSMYWRTYVLMCPIFFLVEGPFAVG